MGAREGRGPRVGKAMVCLFGALSGLHECTFSSAELHTDLKGTDIASHKLSFQARQPPPAPVDPTCGSPLSE